MAISFTCPKCGAAGIMARPRVKARCPHCDAELEVPSTILSAPLIPPPGDGVPSIQKPKSIPWEELKGLALLAILGLISFVIIRLVISWVESP